MEEHGNFIFLFTYVHTGNNQIIFLGGDHKYTYLTDVLRLNNDIFGMLDVICVHTCGHVPGL